jgi:predicted nucleotidyltransferase
MPVIHRFAQAVAQQFHPHKIILFGSYAYGQPHDDSDVDILVGMPARNERDQKPQAAAALRWAQRVRALCRKLLKMP